MRDYPKSPSRSDVTTLIRERQKEQRRGRDNGSRLQSDTSEASRREEGHEPRNARNLQKLQKAGTHLPLEHPEGT